ncbi:putative transcriptional regulator [Gottschalkia purinilytica]|uniref:Putative transcriptional regulator n=1 Tax=Gottschalkia purinilytica TaxID=1503 RepID=A0A0L0WCW2_GOTPU|nr:helix-turn-helix transcriptional regulator [Gottschalkia purinilytica]KNF09324.1 putative transcriptional regulator [Gottschalkia purinilytica]
MNEIKSIRARLNLSVYDISKITGLTPGYISNLENGKRNNPSKETMEKISKALDKTVSEVFFK